MGATTQLTDFSDLYTDLINRARQTTGVTATNNQAKRYINIALHDMHVGFGEKFYWAERNDILRTQQDYTTGTVIATIGSTTLTGSSTLWNTANDFSVNNVRVGGKMVINGEPDVYEVTAIASDTSLTLADAYINTTTAGLSYVYFEDEYDLASDFLRPVDLQKFDSNREIDLISRNDFRRRWPRNKISGKPEIAAIFDRPPSGNTTPRRRVRFWKPPDDFYLIPYSYVTGNLAVSSSGTAAANLSADADEPIVPLQYRHAIVLHALYHWYRDKKNDKRSAEAKAEYVDLVSRIVGDNETGANRPRIRPNVAGYMSKARKPYRGRLGRRFVLGTAFDEMRE
jgi:hypothetical protein|tara:strand:+ start:1075 stop:2097 length:1023 start_codon:yes stop_codon:yes gene_type:complete